MILRKDGAGFISGAYRNIFSMSPFKQKVYDACLLALEEKVALLKNILTGLEEGAESDSKSSAGDKHETSRAMMQLEQEKISRQLQELLGQKLVLEKINPAAGASQIKPGSLVKTNNGYLFLSIALGKIRVDGVSIVAISPASPLGAKLQGLAAGQSIEVNGTLYKIESAE
jgi:transcription elongation GreA/GreB family factor